MMKQKTMSVIFGLLGAMVLSSCSALVQLQDKVIVRFSSNLGSQIPNQLLDRGSLIQEPYQEGLSGYDFQGWYRESNPEFYHEPWDFNENRVDFSITLYARWTLQTFIIQFETSGGDNFNPIEFNLGTEINLPTPNLYGFTFDGWYEDPQKNILFNPINVQAQDYILYAKWLPFPTKNLLFVGNQMTVDFVSLANRIADQTLTSIRFLSTPCEESCLNLDTLEASLSEPNGPVLFQLPFNGSNTQTLMERFSPYMIDLTNQSWTDQTDVALSYQQKVYGFPLTMRADGLIYNTEIIDRYNRLAGVVPINPDNWFNYENLAKAIVALHARKADIGIQSVVSFSPQMPIDSIFNAYLTMGKSAQDQSVLLDLELGRTPTYRIDEYTNWVKLLVDFSDRSNAFTTSLTGQLNAFMGQEAAMMPYVPGFDLELRKFLAPQSFAMAPLGQFSINSSTISVNGNTSWVFINRYAEKTTIDFLKDLLFEYANDDLIRFQVATTLGTIHPFRNDVLQTFNNEFNQTIVNFYEQNSTNPYLFDRLNNQAKVASLRTLHDQWLIGMINRNEFVRELKLWIQNYP
jgi:uncharacterized repeat protein (TIGR02543 family)